MISDLSEQDIPRVVKIHRQELPGFLTELGVEFLKCYYRNSMKVGEVFTVVYKRDGVVRAFATGAYSTRDLNRKILLQDPFRFTIIMVEYLITHLGSFAKIFSTFSYPGFKEDIPELLTIAVSRQYQKKGIGEKLFRVLEERFRQKSQKEFLISAYDRLPANGFYRKIGCRFERSFDFLGEKMNYYRMKLK